MQPQRFCDPVGGRSVYGTFTPLAKFNSTLPSIWVTAPIDARTFFPDMAYGSEAPVSGVTALLAVVDALSKVGFMVHLHFISDSFNPQLFLSLTPSEHVQSPTLKNSFETSNIFFALFNAESWGAAGSQRFVRDIGPAFQCRSDPDGDGRSCQEPYFGNLDFRKVQVSSIQQMLDLGQLGGSCKFVYQGDSDAKCFDMTANTTTAFRVFSTSSDSRTSLLQALSNNAAFATPNGSIVSFQAAEVLGLPPSPLQAFLETKKEINHVHIANHPSVFTNPYYHSALDDASQSDENVVKSLCGLATTVARTVHGLSQTSAVPSEVVANCTLVSELWTCLTKNFSCPLISEFVKCRCL